MNTMLDTVLHDALAQSERFHARLEAPSIRSTIARKRLFRGAAVTAVATAGVIGLGVSSYAVAARLIDRSDLEVVDPSASATIQTSPSPTPVITPTPSLTPKPKQEPAWLISSAGIGGFTLGTQVADLSAQYNFQVEGVCSATFVDIQGMHIVVVGSEPSGGGTVQSVYLLTYTSDVDPPDARTTSGIGVGSTLTELEANYPEGHVVASETGLDRMRAFVAVLDGVSIAFELLDGSDTVVDIGVNADHLEIEYCG